MKKITKLTDAQKARFDEWADKWIEIGLRTGDADRPKFENAVRECYRYAGLEPPKVIVWTTSPLAVALAGPIAAYLIEARKGDAVVDAVRGAVVGAVGDAVVDAVDGAVDGAVRRAVRRAVETVRRSWTKYLGGQFWVGGWYWGGSWTSYFREVCSLELDGNLWQRALAYEATMESACWWYPHKDFVIVSERPTVIYREAADPTRLRGWGSHRLHCETGPAVGFRDGWGVWAWHGVTVTQQIIEHPETITANDVQREQNAEVRRVMVERMGWDRFCTEAKMRLIHEDELHSNFSTVPVSDLVSDGQRLVTAYRSGTEKAQLLEASGMTDFEERPLRFVRLTDPSTGRQYTIRVRHDHKRAYEAVGWTFGLTEEEYKNKIYLRQGDVLLMPIGRCNLVEQRHT